MRRLGSVLATALLVGVVAGCGSSTPTSSTSSASGGCARVYNIWYVDPLPFTPDFARSGKLLEDAGAANCYRATHIGPGPSLGNDIPTMVNQIQSAITDHADGIITYVESNTAFHSVISQARAKGIIVASIGSVGDPDDNFEVGTDNTTFGQSAADFIAKATNGNGQVGIIGTNQTIPNQVTQVNGFKAQIAAKYSNMKVLAWEADNSDAGQAQQKITAMIKAYPTMNYIWIVEGAAPGAIPSAFKEAGVAPGKIGVLAVDAQSSTLQAIQDGWISATLNQCWFDTTPQMAKRIIQWINGKQSPHFIGIPVDPVTKDRLPYAGCPTSITD
jgi:ABC-type sugar transport system substrate-binding protein